MGDQHVHFLKCIGIAKEVNAFPGGQFAFIVLTLNACLSPTQHGLGFQFSESFYLLSRHGKLP